MAVRDDVLATVAAMSAEPPAAGHEVVERLIAQGFCPLRAELLETFVSLAFGRALIRRLAVRSPVVLADNAFVWQDGVNHREITLSDVPEFTSALAVAEEALTTGMIPWEQFKKCCGSAEMDCINKTLEA